MTKGYTLKEIDALEEGWFFYDHAWSLLFELIKKIEGKSVLDVGCGTGIASSIIKACHPKLNIVGLEPNDNASEIWKSRNLTVKIGSATNIPFKDSEFDTVISSHVVEHIDDDSQAIKEIIRVSKRKSIIVVPEGDVNAKNFGSPHLHIYNRKNFSKLINEAMSDFNKVSLSIIPHLHMSNLVAEVWKNND
tara:strand:+ start:132 stop:704 length:573 start_codon:yes stop_codon:yes gene_type:complete